MDKSEREKLQGDPFTGGTPTLLGVLPPGALPGPHKKYWRKIPPELPAAGGEKEPF